MSTSVKRAIPFLLFAAGVVVIVLLTPRFNAAQPAGARLTRGEAKRIADAEAQQIGIPVASAQKNLTWRESPILEKELRYDAALRRRANRDPVIGPRLGSYERSYYRPGVEKFVPWGYVLVSAQSGEVIGARMRLRPQDAAPSGTEAELRPVADRFVHSRTFAGAPSPQFESARPQVNRGRTDWIFRYRVASAFPLPNVVPYLYVHFAGKRLAGWELMEEYADGHAYYGESGGDIATLLVRMAAMYVVLVILLAIFLRKYHAGEAGVSTASLLFAVMGLLMIATDVVFGPSFTEGNQMGSLDALQTTLVTMGFKFVVCDVPLAILVFFAWSVGESYARERWGDRLASFDAILRRDPFNATVGRSLLRGVLVAPAVTAAAMVVGLIPLLLRTAYVSGGPSMEILYLGGPPLAILYSATDAVVLGVGGALFFLASAHRRRILPAGIVVAIALGTLAGAVPVAIAPYSQRLLFGFGGMAAIVTIFLAFDLLTTAVAIFGGTLLAYCVPLASVARGDLFAQYALTLALPLVAIGTFAFLALLTRREVVYSHEDLAPHVRRIVERERVKAEIDAANRIQSALLPLEPPTVAGASVASHYRAATEIGGDYFDFLPQADGQIGIAFGDVSGHGLTSGIVMAMAKSALLVQVGYDASPRTVMNVLNEVVLKTAPRRILMTFFFGILDPATQTLRFSSAGHLDPYVFRAETRTLEPLSSWGFPLGVRRREPFREHVAEFHDGDRLVLYSDGLIEAVDDDGEPFGFDRFEQTILAHGDVNADAMKLAILSAVRKFTRNRPPEDDQTLVVVSFDEEIVSSATA